MALNLWLKRIFDLVIALPLLLLLLPLLVSIAMVVKIVSPGPILYRAKRVGQYGQVFTMHKFRTMHVGADQAGALITGPNDTRIFFVGGILRRTKLDELPQLYDVLRGRMSIVGPRPEDPNIVAKYYTEKQRRTLQVKPGMTSPAALLYSKRQENGPSSVNVVEIYVQKVLEDKLELELSYLEDSNVLTDVKVLSDTAVHIVRELLNELWKVRRNR